MSKTVVALLGSKRKKNTYAIVNQIAAILKQYDIDTELVFLYDYEIKDCVGCQACILGKRCALSDDAQIIREKLINADGIILASPVYMCSISSRMKTFIDRTADWFHRPELIGKPLLNVVTTAGSYERDALTYLSNIAMHWGCALGGAISRKQTTMHKAVKAHELKKFITLINRGSFLYKPSFKHLMLFKVQKVLAQKVLENDTIWWNEHGLSKQLFYFSCRLSPLKIAATSLFYGLFYSFIKKYDDE